MTSDKPVLESNEEIAQTFSSESIEPGDMQKKQEGMEDSDEIEDEVEIEAVSPPGVGRALAVFVGFFVVQFAISMVLGIALSIVYGVTGGDLTDSEQVVSFMESYTLQLVLISSYLSAAILVFWLLKKIRNPRDGFSYAFLGIKRIQPTDLRVPAIVGAGIALVYIILANTLFPLIQNPDNAELGPLTTLAMSGNTELLIWVITALLFAPFIEELLFRSILLKGFLQSWRSRTGYVMAIVISLALFTGLHFQEFAGYPLAALGILSMASAATYFRLKLDNLMAASTVHFSYNAVIVILVVSTQLVA